MLETKLRLGLKDQGRLLTDEAFARGGVRCAVSV